MLTKSNNEEVDDVTDYDEKESKPGMFLQKCRCVVLAESVAKEGQARTPVSPSTHSLASTNFLKSCF